MTTSFQLYRGAKIGECLTQSLVELMESDKLSEEVADKILSQFDKTMYSALEKSVTAKAHFKGNLKTYRFIDNVWQFVLKPVNLKITIPPGKGSGSNAFELNMDSAKLICIDSKLVLKEKEKREGREREFNQTKTEDMMGNVHSEYMNEGFLGLDEATDIKNDAPSPNHPIFP